MSDPRVAVLIAQIVHNLHEQGEEWNLSHHRDPVSEGTVEPYVLHDNAGELMLSAQDLWLLGSKGYLVHEDVIYHPDHWEPCGFEYGGGIVQGHDGCAKAKTDEAWEWGVKRHLWSGRKS